MMDEWKEIEFERKIKEMDRKLKLADEYILLLEKKNEINRKKIEKASKWEGRARCGAVVIENLSKENEKLKEANEDLQKRLEETQVKLAESNALLEEHEIVADDESEDEDGWIEKKVVGVGFCRFKDEEDMNSKITYCSNGCWKLKGDTSAYNEDGELCETDYEDESEDDMPEEVQVAKLQFSDKGDEVWECEKCCAWKDWGVECCGKVDFSDKTESCPKQMKIPSWAKPIGQANPFELLGKYESMIFNFEIVKKTPKRIQIKMPKGKTFLRGVKEDDKGKYILLPDWNDRPAKVYWKDVKYYGSK